MIKFENVVRSYNGKPGCMCGCIGNYSTPIHATTIKTREDEISDRRVKLALNKVNKALSEVGNKSEDSQIKEHGFHAYLQDGFDGEKIAVLETKTRHTVVYYTE